MQYISIDYVMPICLPTGHEEFGKIGEVGKAFEIYDAILSE